MQIDVHRSWMCVNSLLFDVDRCPQQLDARQLENTRIARLFQQLTNVRQENGTPVRLFIGSLVRVRHSAFPADMPFIADDLRCAMP